MVRTDIPGADPEPPASAPDPAAGIRLRLRRVAVDTYHENVAYLHRDCVVYRAEGFQALAKIRVSCGEQGIEAVLNVVDDDRIVATDELGLSEQAFAQLCAGDHGEVRAAQPTDPDSMGVHTTCNLLILFPSPGGRGARVEKPQHHAGSPLTPMGGGGIRSIGATYPPYCATLQMGYWQVCWLKMLGFAS